MKQLKPPQVNTNSSHKPLSWSGELVVGHSSIARLGQVRGPVAIEVLLIDAPPLVLQVMSAPIRKLPRVRSRDFTCTAGPFFQGSNDVGHYIIFGVVVSLPTTKYGEFCDRLCPIDFAVHSMANFVKKRALEYIPPRDSVRNPAEHISLIKIQTQFQVGFAINRSMRIGHAIRVSDTPAIPV